MKEITHVAIRHGASFFSLERPCRHHHVIRMMARDHSVDIPINGEQGFVDPNTGLFIGREQAAQYAFKIGQIVRRKDLLFSEDIW
jgi:hypothetical protein